MNTDPTTPSTPPRAGAHTTTSDGPPPTLDRPKSPAPHPPYRGPQARWRPPTPPHQPKRTPTRRRGDLVPTQPRAALLSAHHTAALLPARYTLAPHPATHLPTRRTAALRKARHAGALLPAQRTTAHLPTRHTAALWPTRHAGTLLAVLITAAVMLFLTALPARASPPTWRWPLDGHPRILHRFAPPPEPWLAGHRGIDLAAPVSTPVLAAGSGTIRFAGPVAGKGVVTIDHPNGLRTTYLPVKPSVRRGQSVTSGAQLGVLEFSEPHCHESCLHWGLIRDTHYLNPLLLLGQAPTRLLPFWTSPPATQAIPGKAPHEDDTTTPSPVLPPTTDPQPQAAADTTTPPTYTGAAAPTSREPTPKTPPSRTDPADPTTAAPASFHAHQPATPINFLAHSASSVPTEPAIGISALLGALVLIIALRRARHTRADRRSRTRGQHRKGRHRSRPRRHRPPTSC
ncbi:peptidoglycan DD-metalloendopeptidase family protein [Nonomuraea terrae]|uniref:peptidoglycan DD-metalloendopeptidase family protein n=1 Tax=Nonomuraea terrae TaxID=2530383 RepID=UPI00379F0F08